MNGEFVLDASVALAWCFEDEITAYVESVLLRCQRGAVIHVPSIWPLEISNALLTAERRGRVAPERAEQFASELIRFEIHIDVADHAALESIRRIARSNRLTAYDASYLELAFRKGVPLVTLDADLRSAARALNVALIESESPVRD